MYLGYDFELMDELVDRVETRRKIEEYKKWINSPIWRNLSKKEQDKRKRILIETNEAKRACRKLDLEIKRDQLREYWNIRK